MNRLCVCIIYIFFPKWAIFCPNAWIQNMAKHGKQGSLVHRSCLNVLLAWAKTPSGVYLRLASIGAQTRNNGSLLRSSNSASWWWLGGVALTSRPVGQ